MATKNTTQVLIGGKIYTMSGYESEDYLQRVAGYLNNKITEIKAAEGYTRMSQEMRSLLLNLNTADDYFKLKEKSDQLSESLSSKDKELYEIKHELISTQMAASALEEQTKLATSMELKALQAQINPHFLFNTINTIASLIRTDPTKARELLREFAVFYRSTLEDANDLIVLDREIKQVQRYFMFETARFGDERLSLEIDIEPEMMEMMVPSFMIQPLVENSVHHAMKSEGKLNILIKGVVDDDKIRLSVTDDGTGMSEETLRTMMNPDSSQGLGIAVKNVRDRMRNYFGPEARMEITSELGRGTTVTFVLDRDITGNFVQTAGMQELSH